MADIEKKIKRLRYHNGQLLDVSDFEDEQAYHRKMRMRHNRFVHSWGIVEGLEVTIANKKITVAPGMALDNDGQELCLLGEASRDPPPGLKSTTRYVTAKFEEPDDTDPKMVFKNTDSGEINSRRTIEQATVEVTPTDTKPDGDGLVIVLAKLDWNDQGKITVDPSARSRSVSSSIDPAADLTVRGLLATGNLGVGTTSPENAEGWNRVLDVVHSINAKISVRAAGIDARVMAHGGIYGALAGMLVGAKSNHALSLVTNAATRMTIDSAGKVGIGTTGPGAKLEVAMVADDTNTKPLVVRNGTTNYLTMLNDGNVGIGTASPGAKLEVAIAENDTGTNPLAIGKGALPYLMMLNDGNVGIGSEPDAKLLVSGLLAATSDNEELIGLRINPIFSDNGRSGVKYYGLIVANGNVGIGTQSPGAKLEVAIAKNDTSTNPLAIGKKGELPYLMMLNNGNVGIGTDNPGNHKLKVQNGDTYLDGKLTVSEAGSLSFGMQVRQMINLYGTEYGIGIQSSTQYYRTVKNFAWYKGGSHDHGELDAGGGTVQMVIKDGNVGIGTTSPRGRLDIFVTNQDGTGTITSSGTTVTGSETVFQTQLQVGGSITASGQTRTITAISSGTLTVDGAFSPNITAATAFAFSPPALLVNGGNVGIGTRAAKDKLDVRGRVRVQQLVFADETGTAYPDNWLGMATVGTTKWLHIGGITDGNAAERKRRLALYADTTFVSGNVGIGATDPGDLKLKVEGHTYINGGLWATAIAHKTSTSGGWSIISPGVLGEELLVNRPAPAPSDLRFKTDLRSIRNALEKVLQLHGKYYRWGETGLKFFTRDIPNRLSVGPDATEEENQRLWAAEQQKAYEALAGEKIGLIAQDVETVVPEVVHEDEEGYKYIHYQQLTALLVEAIKEQNALIQALSIKVAALEAV